ncbi:MAG: hypothetical protein LLG44_07150 [Chloroflexi bacterium]|nr:hypothetical protein [Chloroflexota bacterium]
MRKHIILWGTLVVFALLVLLPPRAAFAQQAEVMITSPAPNSEVSGVVAIMGSASTSNFSFFKVEFGAGSSPSSWTLIGDTHANPIVNGQLETWDTSRLADGVYTLRLQAVKTDGNYDEYFVRGITVASNKPTVTPTGATPTRRPSATPADNVTPQATATLQVIQPTQGAQIATATPTPVRVTSQNTLQLDTEGWKQAFIVGATAMGVVFLILGIIFGLRRLL